MKTNIDSFITVKGKTLIKSTFLAWTGLRHAVPSNLRVNIPDFKAVFYLNSYKCRVYYGYLIKKTYERPRKWTKVGEEFDLIDDQISKAYLLPIRVASEPYLRSFQYKVLNSILFTNDILYKISFVSNPNCCFCERNKETANHLFFSCSFSHSFSSEVTDKIFKETRQLRTSDVMIGILKEEMDLVSYVIILGKNYLWTCRQKVIKP